jgi:predicted glycoside hydrolase/deacetylase ChbG (UPF0249 family)
MTERELIVNADDFGASPAVNAGVIRGHREGVVTSTSLIVRGPAAASAAEFARRHNDLDVGLHIDLAEWVCHDGAWITLYEVVALDDVEGIDAEVTAQVAAFRALVGRDPTHLDSHQHLHRREPVRGPVLAAAERLGVPVREAHADIRYCGAYYGQCADGTPYPDGITVEHLIDLVTSIPPGITELACHPADGVDLVEGTMYREERCAELAALCDRRVRDAIAGAGIRLRSFAGLGSSRAEAEGATRR